MDINIKKRHIIVLIAMLFALYLIIPNCKIINKMLNAQDIEEMNGIYCPGDYVTLNFNKILYLEYEGVYGGTQRNYAVCGTPEGDVCFVNGLSDTYVLVEITDSKIIEKIETSQKENYQIIGIIENCSYDLTEFTQKWDTKVTLEKKIVIKQITYQDIYSAKIINGCIIMLFCIILFCYWGGIKSLLRRKISLE